LLADGDKAGMTALFEVATWDNVPLLLFLRSFDLDSKLVLPEE